MDFVTDAHLQEYLRDGFTVIRGGFSARTCELLLERIQHITASWDLEKLRAASKPFTTHDQTNRSSDAWFLTSGDAIRPFFEEEGEAPTVNKIGHALHELDPVFRRLLHCSKIQSGLQKLGYEAPVPVQSMYIAKSAKVGGEVSAHQDSTFLVSEPFSVCGVWMALRKATVDNGCMFFVKGSHLKQPVDRLFLRDPADEGRTIFEPPEPAPYDVRGAVAVEADVGDVVIFHGAVVHFSAPNRSNVPRPAYVMHFTEGKCAWHPRNWLRSRFFRPIYGEPFSAPIVDVSRPGPDLERLWDLYMTKFGFAIVVGHGVPIATMQNLQRELVAFFSQPEQFKRRFSAGGYGRPGYNPLASEAVADVGNRSPDPIESLYVRPDIPRWAELESLLSAAEAYTKALDTHVLKPLLRLSARALGLADESALEKLFVNHSQSLKLSHYPPASDKRSLLGDGRVRYGAHTDWEGFTLLLADERDDEENGLEVLLENGQWVSPGRAIPHSFIVNAGDFVPLWTNGRWRSPVHRVIAKDKSRSRYSIPYFTGPNLRAMIQPLLEDVIEDRKGFNPVEAGDWLEAKRSKARI